MKTAKYINKLATNDNRSLLYEVVAKCAPALLEDFDRVYKMYISGKICFIYSYFIEDEKCEVFEYSKETTNLQFIKYLLLNGYKCKIERIEDANFWV